MIGGIRQRHLARQALALLGRERELLLHADFDSIGTTSQALARLGASLEGAGSGDDPAFAALLVQVRAAAERNMSLAEASRRGVRAAMAARDEAGAGGRLATYTGTGARRDIAGPSTTRDRRA